MTDLQSVTLHPFGKLAHPSSYAATTNITYTQSDHLPHPAVKLVVGQHLWIHPDCHSFAWLVVGAFYDAEGRELWHIELRLGAVRIPPSSWFGRLLREYASRGRGKFLLPCTLLMAGLRRVMKAADMLVLQ